MRPRISGACILLCLACRTAPSPAPTGDPALDLSSPEAWIRADGACSAWIEGRSDLVPLLVDALEDPSPAVRAWASRALVELTGESHGYRPYLEPEERREAVARWRARIEAGGGWGPEEPPDSSPIPPPPDSPP